MDEEDLIISGNDEELNCLLDQTDEKDIDEVLVLSGPFGRFQILVQIFFMYANFTIGYQSVISYFTGDNPPWTCARNDSSNFCIENFGKEITVANLNFTARCHLNRDEWMYTKPKSYSYVTEFDLVCNKCSIAGLVGSGFFLGSAVGGILSGILSDIYGRKRIFGIALFILSFCSVGCTLVNEVWQLILLRSLIGATQGAGVGLAFVYLGEFIPSSHRSLSSNIFRVSFALSSFFIVAVAYFVRKWRDLQLYVSFPPIVAWVILLLMPQSPRWLLASGKHLKAEAIMHNIYKLNGKSLVNLKLKREPSDDISRKAKKYTYIDLFRRCDILLLVVAQGVIWFADDLLFFGVIFAAADFGGNIYQNYVFICLPDLPSCFIAVYLCNRFGRKKTVLISNFISGIFIGAIALFISDTDDNHIIRVVLAIIGKCFSGVGFSGLCLWTFELFPTIVRSQGFSLCYVIARVGGSVAPFLIDVLLTINPMLPYLAMGVMGVLASFSGLILPETNHCPSRELYEDFFPQKQKHNVNVNAVVAGSINND